MNETTGEVAGLRALVVQSDVPSLVVVMLHGYAMVPEALSPFARSLGIDAAFLLPEGPVAAVPQGRAWWHIDPEQRARALQRGPRDLAAEHPPGAPAARATLRRVLREASERWPGLPLAVVGFSQGGMLACDTLLRERPRLAALALLSSSRISAEEWEPLASALRGLPVFVSHGRQDPDLAYAAGEALRDFLSRGGGDVTWVPFDDGHEIPLVVWRALRKFLRQIRRAT